MMLMMMMIVIVIGERVVVGDFLVR